MLQATHFWNAWVAVIHSQFPCNPAYKQLHGNSLVQQGADLESWRRKCWTSWTEKPEGIREWLDLTHLPVYIDAFLRPSTADKVVLPQLFSFFSQCKLFEWLASLFVMYGHSVMSHSVSTNYTNSSLRCEREMSSTVCTYNNLKSIEMFN